MLVTTGPQSTQQPLDTPLADAAAQLKDTGVDIYSLGIGPNVVPSELEAIASRPENVLRSQTASLPIIASQLNAMIRSGKVYDVKALHVLDINSSNFISFYFNGFVLRLLLLLFIFAFFIFFCH